MPHKKMQLSLQTRNALVLPASVNEEDRTFELVWTTGAPYERYDWNTGHPFIEDLEVSEEAIDLTRLNNGAPFLDSHNSFNTDDIRGVVESAWIDGKEGKAKVRVAVNDEAADSFWNKVKQGIIRNISVGYSVEKYVEKIVEGVRHMIAVKWTPLELSAVAVPADAGARIRSKERAYECVIESHAEKKERKMPKVKRSAAEEIEKIKVDAEEAIDEVVLDAENKIEEIKTEAEEKIEEIASDSTDMTEGDEVRSEDKEEDKKSSEDEHKRTKPVQNIRANTIMEILDVCELAGIDLKSARSFVKSGKSVQEIRDHLINKRAQGFENNPTVSVNKSAAVRNMTISQRAAEKYKK